MQWRCWTLLYVGYAVRQTRSFGKGDLAIKGAKGTVSRRLFCVLKNLAYKRPKRRFLLKAESVLITAVSNMDDRFQAVEVLRRWELHACISRMVQKGMRLFTCLPESLFQLVSKIQFRPALLTTFSFFSLQRLPFQAPSYRRLRCRKVMSVASICWWHLHWILHFHYWCRLCKFLVSILPVLHPATICVC